ncbi:MAG: hypothetical protein SPE49_04050 [Campylobacter sp.]|uniref:hypothetical protein n=1 Tax=Campylobacter sp. TaxID=205 RepID=UPI002A81209C|nr:hypothetical protein [Campylobacter sp.]MDY5115128.1 hypothetical protein [Campylobacter sp.]
MSISDVVDIRKLIDTEPLEYLRALRENRSNYKEIVLEEIKKREDYKNALIKEFLNNLGELALYKQELSNIEINEIKGKH